MPMQLNSQIYDQEGVLQPVNVSCPMFAEWLRVHDRYNGVKEKRPENELNAPLAQLDRARDF